MGLCKYDSKHEIKRKITEQSKKVFCSEYDKEFSSIREAEKDTGIKRQYISNCCNGNQKYSTDKITGIKLHWSFA